MKDLLLKYLTSKSRIAAVLLMVASVLQAKGLIHLPADWVPFLTGFGVLGLRDAIDKK